MMDLEEARQIVGQMAEQRTVGPFLHGQAIIALATVLVENGLLGAHLETVTLNVITNDG